MKRKFLLSYDVHRDHERIIDDLTKRGWHSVSSAFTLDEQKPTICYLPETTWWKEFNNAREGINEFEAIVGDKNNIIRYVITVFEDWICTTINPMKHQIEEAKRLRLSGTTN